MSDSRRCKYHHFWVLKGSLFGGGFTIPQKAHVCITAIIPIYIEQYTQKGVKRGSKKRSKKRCFGVLKKSSFLTLLGYTLKGGKKGCFGVYSICALCPIIPIYIEQKG